MPSAKDRMEAASQQERISTMIRRRPCVVVVELLHNGIEHGCRHLDEARRIALSLGRRYGRLNLEVAPPDVASTVATWKTGGLDIHPVREISSRFSYSDDDGWNVERITIEVP